MSGLFSRIAAGSRLLSWTGWIHMAMAVIFILCGAFDPTEVYGVNVWAKPVKFCVSIAIYVWTMALLFGPLGNWPAKRWLGRGIAIAMFAEIFLIAMQSARGVPSHFNNTTPLDAAVFGVMGLMILLNTLLAFGVFLGYVWRDVAAEPLVVAGVRTGLVMFMMGSLIGVIMVVLQGHTIGAGDGGPGLPLLNWSTMHGDLRIAHAVGLHALQAIPLAAWWISTRMRGSSRMAQGLTLMAVSLVYLGGLLLTLRQAFAGKPLVG
ncbi:MAG: hypothetical protein ABI972_15970 [Acidobacteriota bacterium]